jgi:protease I
MNKLDGKKIAIIATDGVEQVELLKPRDILTQAGAQCTVISNKEGEIKGWDMDHWDQKIPVDLLLDQASANEFDALVIPGGVINPDKMRLEDKALRLVIDFYDQGKPIGAICHGPWLLVETDLLEGKRVTSWPSLRTDIENAGGMWVDEQVVVDDGIVTSRKPDDIPAFADKLIEEIAEGIHEREPVAGRSQAQPQLGEAPLSGRSGLGL